MPYGPDYPSEPLEDYPDSLEQKVDDVLDPALEIQRAINDVIDGRKPEDLYLVPDLEPAPAITAIRDIPEKESLISYEGVGDPKLFSPESKIEDIEKNIDLERALMEGKRNLSVKVGLTDRRYPRR